MLKEEFVFVLMIAVLPNETRDNFENYKINKKKENNENKLIQWYNDNTILGELRYWKLHPSRALKT